jgi:hypothetical protein
MTTRRAGHKYGTYHWTYGGKTYDGFVDGGKNSPFVTVGGNAPAHSTKPYYLTSSEVSSQVTWNGSSGSIRVYDRPGAVYAHEKIMFETLVVAVNYAGSGKDKILGSFKWGSSSFGSKVTTKIKFNSTISSEARNIIKHDYPNYSF